MYVITGLHTGGAEIRLQDLLSRLDREKFDPVIVSIIPIGKIGKEIVNRGDKVIFLNMKRKLGFLFVFFRFLRIIKKEKPDIIHSHLFHANILARLAKIFNRKIKIISSIRNENIGGKNREIFLRMTDSLSDITNTISENVTQKMIEKKVAPANRIITVYNGIDVNKFYPNREKGEEIKKNLKIEKRLPILISVGRLSRAKGYYYLIESIEKLKQKYPDVVLLILGEGKEKDKLEKQIEQKGLKNNIFLLGNKDNVCDYLNSADLFVSSSIWEGLPTVILEAMACNLPVVATRVGGVEEIMRNNNSKFLAKPGEVEDLFDKINLFLSLSKDEKEEIVKNNRKLVEKEFSLDRMAREYTNVYNKLIHS